MPLTSRFDDIKETLEKVQDDFNFFKESYPIASKIPPETKLSTPDCEKAVSISKNNTTQPI